MNGHFLDGVTLPLVVGWVFTVVQVIFGVGYLVGRGDRSSRRDQGKRIGAVENGHAAVEQRLAALEASRKNG